jgi:hypothetical protein
LVLGCVSPSTDALLFHFSDAAFKQLWILTQGASHIGFDYVKATSITLRVEADKDIELESPVRQQFHRSANFLPRCEPSVRMLEPHVSVRCFLALH